MSRYLLVIFSALLPTLSFGQYNWKLKKDKDDIKVYTSDIPHSSFKAIKVECTFTGNYAKLIAVVSNVAEFDKWVYHNKGTKLLKKNSPRDFIYYTETRMPWPLSNRDVIINMKIQTDSLPKFLLISGRALPDLIPVIPTRVRVQKFSSNWKITMPTSNSIHIDYIVELDPGGSIPGWAANMFADKGPFGSFSNLGVRLRQ